jgi:cardiolipin synthase
VVDETGRQSESTRPAAAGAGVPPVVDHSHDVYTVANIITVLRLILVPIFFAVLVTGTNDALAFALFVLAASTDWLDGQIARRTGTVTQIGKAIDPLVDRLLIAAGVLGVYIEERLPLWVVLVLLARDVYLLYGAWRLEAHHVRLPVTFLGKATTFTLLTGFSIMILGWPVFTVAGEQWYAGTLIVYAGVALSLTTAVQYTFIARKVARDLKVQQAGSSGD